MSDLSKSITWWPHGPCPRCGYDGLGISVEGGDAWMRERLLKTEAKLTAAEKVVEAARECDANNYEGHSCRGLTEVLYLYDAAKEAR